MIAFASLASEHRALHFEMHVEPRVVLLVEDDPSLLRTLSASFAARHFAVLEARNYDSALAQLGTLVPDIACINLELPCQSGYELCEYLRSHRAYDEVPLIVTAGRHSSTDMAYAEEAGANVFLAKPFATFELSAIADELLSRARLSEPAVELNPFQSKAKCAQNDSCPPLDFLPSPQLAGDASLRAPRVPAFAMAH